MSTSTPAAGSTLRRDDGVVSTSTPAGGSTLRRDVSLAAWQVVYEQRAFWRNRARAFFSFLMPVMFLIIFATIYHGQMIAGPHGAISYDSFFVPGILAYGIIATTFVNMALSTSILREQGVLKRMAGTPWLNHSYGKDTELEAGYLSDPTIYNYGQWKPEKNAYGFHYGGPGWC